MDRGYGHRTVLSTVAALGGVAMLMWVNGSGAQTPSPTPSVSGPVISAPSTAATPWVQASPPLPGLSAKGSPRSEKVPLPPAVPTAQPSREEVARAMARKREEELARQTAATASPAARPLPPHLLLPRLSPEENEAYERNLALWLALSAEEKKEIRGLAAERVQQETAKAYESSGLNLNEDQREVFALRYRQERRRLERDLQEKARAERDRRLPEIMDRLRHEFANGNVPRPKPATAQSPTPADKL